MVFKEARRRLKLGSLLPSYFIFTAYVHSNINLLKLDVRGETASITLEFAPLDKLINGIVSGIQQTHINDDGQYHYQICVVPWLEFLKYQIGSNIYHNKSVVEIITELFAELACVDYKFQLHKQYKKIAYCVRNNQSAFAFITRLMHEAGIYYYFNHQSDKHYLVITDALMPGTGNDFNITKCTGSFAKPCVGYFAKNYELQNQNFYAQSHTWETQTNPQHEILNKHSVGADLQYYQYSNSRSLETNQKLFTSLQKQLHTTEFRMQHYLALSNYAGIGVGDRFNLQDVGMKQENEKYYVYRIKHIAYDNSSLSGRKNTRNVVMYSNIMHCQNVITAFSKNLKSQDENIFYKQLSLNSATRQTAIVVGLDNHEDIYTDQLARVKLQFIWESEIYSCWVPVLTLWAGQQHASQIIPKVGQEVLVDFVEGNKDRPIILGVIANAQHPLPFNPHKHPYQTGLYAESKSTGHNTKIVNKICFDAQATSPNINVACGKDFTLTVRNDQLIKSTNTINTNVEKQDYCLKVGREINMQSQITIRLQVGGSYIEINKDNVIFAADKIDVVSLPSPPSLPRKR
ncbi:MAG: hypothetical protein COB50_04105 [Thiotrichales bacterium]|nr:MAG: hypothetical protein COB50_04105 [Thiotrichales bacterium]